MLILSILITILMIMIIKRIKMEKRIKKTIGIYILIVMAIIIFSMFNPFGLYKVSDIVYVLWIINVIIFSGVLILRANIMSMKSKKEKTEVNGLTQKILKSRIILYAQIILSLILVFYSFKFNLIVNSIEDAAQIRMAKFTLLFSSYTENVFYNYIITCLYKAMTIITSILIVNKKIKNPITIIGVINVLLYSSIGYGRMNLYEFLLFILFAYIFCNEQKIIKKSKKDIIKFIVIVIIVFVVGVCATAIRTGVKITDVDELYNKILKEQIEQIAIYFTGGFRALDIFLQNGFEGIEKYTLGRATFAGIDEILEIFFTIFGKKYVGFNSMVGGITQASIIIGNNVTFNAFYTCLMNYISDFGYAGVIICPILYGNFVFYCIKNGIENNNIISKVLLIYVLMNTISTIYRWNYQAGSTTFILIVYIIINNLIKRTKKEHENFMDCKYNFSFPSTKVGAKRD